MKCAILVLVVCLLRFDHVEARKRDKILAAANQAKDVAVRIGIAAQNALKDMLAVQAWWRNAVVYQIQLSSFKDSDGDGVGDIKGINQKLSYLKHLGVDALLIYPPVMYPKFGPGYGLATDRKIDPVYGNMVDVRNLIDAVHQYGLHIIIDFVPNRLSPQHPWFAKSEKKEGKYTDYFMWKPAEKYDEDGDPVPPSNWFDVNDRNIWIWSERRGEFYLAHGAEHVPVFQLGNPDVAQEMMENMKFWLDNGVDGFRVDALEFLCEERHFQKYIDNNPWWVTRDRTKISLDNNYNLPDNCHLAKIFGDKVGDYIKADKKPRVLLVQSFGGVEEQVRHYHGEEIDGNPRFMIPINIQLMENLSMGSQAPIMKDLIDSWLDNLADNNVATWIMSNQDTGHLASIMGPEFLGAMNMLLLMLPGISLVNMGQEIGMQDTYIRQDLAKDTYALLADPRDYWAQSRDFYRTPMQWDDSISAGFSTNRQTWLPVNPNYFCVNVANEERVKNSDLKLFRAMAELRHSSHTLTYGSTQVFAPDPYILVVKRYMWNHPSYILVINTDLLLREAYVSGYGPHPDGDTVTVVLASRNSDLKPGQRLQGPLYAIRLLPRTAVLLKTNIWIKKKGFFKPRSRMNTKLDVVQ